MRGNEGCGSDTQYNFITMYGMHAHAHRVDVLKVAYAYKWSGKCNEHEWFEERTSGSVHTKIDWKLTNLCGTVRGGAGRCGIVIYLGI
jgi:hypothetical protein